MASPSHTAPGFMGESSTATMISTTHKRSSRCVLRCTRLALSGGGQQPRDLATERLRDSPGAGRISDGYDVTEKTHRLSFCSSRLKPAAFPNLSVIAPPPGRRGNPECLEVEPAPPCLAHVYRTSQCLCCRGSDSGLWKLCYFYPVIIC
ncbi:unnamed protein product [Pleuronectes platessa]|uniref:Uncharacterized protein n=1 Tax=Pleuronectes platessa TaxID=8262 RepID=A0A9N7YCW9_PLEPL|nr:unnamed protein product [Pleuronectes platessa]